LRCERRDAKTFSRHLNVSAVPSRFCKVTLHRVSYQTHSNHNNCPHQYLKFDKMGVTKKMITPGNGTDKPKSGDTITMEYTGNLYSAEAAEHKGKQYV